MIKIITFFLIIVCTSHVSISKNSFLEQYKALKLKPALDVRYNFISASQKHCLNNLTDTLLTCRIDSEAKLIGLVDLINTKDFTSENHKKLAEDFFSITNPNEEEFKAFLRLYLKPKDIQASVIWRVVRLNIGKLKSQKGKQALKEKYKNYLMKSLSDIPSERRVKVMVHHLLQYSSVLFGVSKKNIASLEDYYKVWIEKKPKLYEITDNDISNCAKQQKCGYVINHYKKLWGFTIPMQNHTKEWVKKNL